MASFFDPQKNVTVGGGALIPVQYATVRKPSSDAGDHA
jgi:hypothetical protein